MSCPHTTKPGPCSQCIPDAPVKRVTLEDHQLLVDGVVARTVESPAPNLYTAIPTNRRGKKRK